MTNKESTEYFWSNINIQSVKMITDILNDL